MVHVLLKNTGDTYSQTEYIGLSDQVNSFSRFLSISPEEFLHKVELEFPESMKRITDGPYDKFDIDINNSKAVDKVKDAFSKRFKELVHENNHTMPFSYKILDFFTKKIYLMTKSEGEKSYAQKKADEKLDALATLRFWSIGKY